MLVLSAEYNPNEAGGVDQSVVLFFLQISQSSGSGAMNRRIGGSNHDSAVSRMTTLYYVLTLII